MNFNGSIKYFLILIVGGIVLSNFQTLKAQEESDDSWRVGFRIGDPTGFQLQWLNNNSRLELNAGRYFNFERFDFSTFIHEESPILLGGDARLEKYQINRSYLVQLNLILGTALDSANGLDLYYGGGIAYRDLFIEYQYQLQSSGNIVVRELQKQDYGINGVVGIEQKLEDKPISLYLDGGVFVALNNEFRPWLQFGVGIRYHFQ